MSAPLWRIAMTVPGRAADALAAALEPHVSALTAMEDSPGGSWSIEGIAEDEPVRPIVLTALALAAATVGTPPPDTVIERSEERRVGKECVSTCRSRWSPYH